MKPLRIAAALTAAFVLPQVAFAALPGDDALTEAENARRDAPGEEITLPLPESGGFILVYVPTDYDPTRTFPAIFCYHGAGGSATTWPFRQATHGEGFLVVGMEYATEEYGRRFHRDFIPQEIEQFHEAFRVVSANYRIDENAAFMGGFSQGGYSTSILGERLLKRLAGLLLLGAGRAYIDFDKPPTRDLRNKPIYIGCGDQDATHFPRAQRAAELYEKWGADVVFDPWEGVGHTWNDRATTRMEEWLREHADRKDDSE